MQSTTSDSTPAARVAIAPRAMDEGAASLLPNLYFPILKPWGDGRVPPFKSVQAEDVPGSTSDSVVPTEKPAERRVPVLNYEEYYGIREVREKLMFHLQEATDRLNLMATFLPKAPALDPVTSSASVLGTTASDEAAAPLWNRRTGRVILGAHENQGRVSRFPLETAETRTVRFRSGKAERQKWPKFAVSLTREEIEEDIYSMTGCMARRRPRKRPTVVQKQINTLFPGLRLSEITGDSYKLPHER